MKALARRVTALEAAKAMKSPERNAAAFVDPETGDRRRIFDLCEASLIAFDMPDFARVRHGQSTDRGMATPNPDLVKFGALGFDRQDAFIAAIFLIGHRIVGGRRADLPAFEWVPAGNRQDHSVLTAEGWAEMLALSEDILMGRPASTRAIIGGLLDEPWP